MAIYYSTEEYPTDRRGTAVALGFFDGVHRGHRAVLGNCADGKGDMRCVALTFRESPAKSLGRTCPPLLTDNARKAALMGELGVDDVIFADFDGMKDVSAERFVADILSGQLNARRVCCGFNYRFGRNGEGDTAALTRLCAARGIEVDVCEPVYVGGESVSSTRVRELLLNGEVERANELLAYRYAIAGEIGSGNHIGTTMGFPTVNIPIPREMAVPKRGVYATRIAIDGAVYRGATNIGVHPTVGANELPLCETFLLDYHGESLYGKNAVCELVRFVRAERRFDSLDALTAQVEKDCAMIAQMTL